jgi:hypothetical protein
MNAQLDIFSRVSTRVSARGMERKRAGQDRAKDAARQAEIESMDWRVFRLAGRQCMELDRFNDDSMIESFSAGRHLLRDLCQFKPTNIRVKAAA